MKLLRVFAALTFLLAGLVGLIGCIWIPGNYQPPDGKPRPETQIGKPNSGKPLELTRAKREDVERVLGPAAYETTDRRKIAYAYNIEVGFFALCFISSKHPEELRFLRLEFDAENRLKSYKVMKSVFEANDDFFIPVESAPARRKHQEKR